ncbi:MAG: AI-2E family transporter, partial [Gammaproteobacteria bacterium]|nr:AI-2E family transporter [Gammaproteobacteria bacterium]
MDFLKSWYQRYFSDPQVVILALLLVLGFAFVVVTGDILAPVLASVVIAYLLEGLVEAVERLRIPRNPSVYVVFTIFILVLIAVLF